MGKEQRGGGLCTGLRCWRAEWGCMSVRLFNYSLEEACLLHSDSLRACGCAGATAHSPSPKGWVGAFYFAKYFHFLGTVPILQIRKQM